MSDDQLYQSVGRIEGKVDALTTALSAHILQNDAAHSDIFKGLACVKQDINMAKGAKGALMWGAGFVATAVTAAGHAIERMLK